MIGVFSLTNSDHVERIPFEIKKTYDTWAQSTSFGGLYLVSGDGTEETERLVGTIMAGLSDAKVVWLGKYKLNIGIIY
jgi:hypothetical protein